jgi:calcineurin-like phosphoesterase family protein
MKGKIFFISDTHFGHENVIKMEKLNFKTIEEMNEHIIEKWNMKVSNEDIIYIIGDMFYKCSTETIINILDRLNGKKHLIIGNHDESWLSKINYKKYFVEEPSITKIITVEQRKYLLCHYPMISFNLSGYTEIYGHIHHGLDDERYIILKEY